MAMNMREIFIRLNIRNTTKNCQRICGDYIFTVVCRDSCGTQNHYLACQGFCHPLKWSQRLFDRKFYPDFRIRPNVPWQFFFSVLTTGSQRMPGDQKSISLLLSLLSNHYQLEALSFLSTNPCNSIWFFQPVVYETFENVPLSKSRRSRMLSRPELLVRHKD